MSGGGRRIPHPWGRSTPSWTGAPSPSGGARTGRIEDTIGLGFPPTSVADAGRAVWVTDGVGDRAVPFNLEDGRALPAVGVGRGASRIAPGARSLGD